VTSPGHTGQTGDVMKNQQAGVVVIGGGIVGTSCAWYLAQRGVDVTLLEKGTIAEEQSSRAWGFVRQQGRDPAEMPLMIACNTLWRDLPAQLGVDIEWVQAGNLAVAADDERMDQFRDWLTVAREFDLDTQILTREQVLNLIPEMTGPYAGGMFTPSDGHAEPMKATSAIAGAARKAGATIYTHCAAEGFDVTNGRISAVITERGTIRTDTVICAAGLRSTRLARMVGVAMPQIAVRATVAETTPVGHITGIGAWTPVVSYRQRRQTGTFYVARGATSDHDVDLDSIRFARLFLPNYLKNRRLFQMHVGRELIKDVLRALPWSRARQHPFRHTVGVEPTPNQTTAERSLDGLVTMIPSLDGIGIQRTWAGLIDSTPDAVPVIDEVDSPRGFFLATGYSGHGYAMGPITGKLLAEWIVDGQPSIDLSGMRFNRFREGKLASPKNVL
jgi:glycine/D-amino acid oxidase-like deaminating enzyme